MAVNLEISKIPLRTLLKRPLTILENFKTFKFIVEKNLKVLKIEKIKGHSHANMKISSLT